MTSPRPRRAAASLAALLLLSLQARAAIADGQAVARRGQPVMGTILTVTVIAATAQRAGRLADAAIDEARRWDDALTIWRPDGELARFNARSGSGRVLVSERLHRALAAMLDLSRRSGGAFEPAVATLPDRGDAGATLVGIADALVLSDRSASLRSGSALDPGGIGKGLALDAAIGLLRSGGAAAAFLDFGSSSLTALGAPPDDPEGWTVELPSVDGQSPPRVWKLRNESLSTSRAAAPDTKPILDPRTRLPVAGPREATVRHTSAAVADAWSTALVVLGREGLRRAEADGIEARLQDGGERLATPGFR